MTNFAKLGLSESIVGVLDQLGFENPTPIQEQSIPLLLKNDPTDFIGLAQTGTGKTAAYGLPLVDLINAENQTTQALFLPQRVNWDNKLRFSWNYFHGTNGISGSKWFMAEPPSPPRSKP